MLISALSVVKPWGIRIAEGKKTLEIRSWRPVKLPLEHLLIVENERRLMQEGDLDLNGYAVAVVSVRDVHIWTPAEAEAACSVYEPGWLAWRIENVRRIQEPFPALAARKIYQVEVEASLLADLIDGKLGRIPLPEM